MEVFFKHKYMYVSASAFEGKSEEEIEMMKIMGFGGFETTKVCTPVLLNNISL